MNPVISIVTVVRNNAEGFRKTALSVTGQQYHPLEFIVIDGGSTDGTVHVIEEYAAGIAYWISEPDKGIYDAMNKGIEHARGEWILFMNAGDRFYDNGVLTRFFSVDHGDAEVIYGDGVADYAPFRVYDKGGNTNDLWKGMICSHQSMFIRTKLMKEEGFALNYPIAADFDMASRLFRDRRNFLYREEPVCIFDAAGISNQRYMQSWRERYQISGKYSSLTWKGHLYYGFLFWMFFATMLTYRILPEQWILRILKIRNRNRLILKRDDS